MNEQEQKVMASINEEIKRFVLKHGYVPYQLTVSSHEYEVYKNLFKRGIRATYKFAGINWQINVQSCKVVVMALDQAWGRNV